MQRKKVRYFYGDAGSQWCSVVPLSDYIHPLPPGEYLVRLAYKYDIGESGTVYSNTAELLVVDRTVPTVFHGPCDAIRRVSCGEFEPAPSVSSHVARVFALALPPVLAQPPTPIVIPPTPAPLPVPGEDAEASTALLSARSSANQIATTRKNSVSARVASQSGTGGSGEKSSKESKKSKSTAMLNASVTSAGTAGLATDRSNRSLAEAQAAQAKLNAEIAAYVATQVAAIMAEGPQLVSSRWRWVFQVCGSSVHHVAAFAHIDIDLEQDPFVVRAVIKAQPAPPEDAAPEKHGKGHKGEKRRAANTAGAGAASGAGGKGAADESAVSTRSKKSKGDETTEVSEEVLAAKKRARELRSRCLQPVLPLTAAQSFTSERFVIWVDPCHPTKLGWLTFTGAIGITLGPEMYVHGLLDNPEIVQPALQVSDTECRAVLLGKTTIGGVTVPAVSVVVLSPDPSRCSATVHPLAATPAPATLAITSPMVVWSDTGDMAASWLYYGFSCVPIYEKDSQDGDSDKLKAKPRKTGPASAAAQQEREDAERKQIMRARLGESAEGGREGTLVCNITDPKVVGPDDDPPEFLPEPKELLFLLATNGRYGVDRVFAVVREMRSHTVIVLCWNTSGGTSVSRHSLSAVEGERFAKKKAEEAAAAVVHHEGKLPVPKKGGTPNQSISGRSPKGGPAPSRSPSPQPPGQPKRGPSPTKMASVASLPKVVPKGKAPAAVGITVDTAPEPAPTAESEAEAEEAAKKERIWGIVSKFIDHDNVVGVYTEDILLGVDGPFDARICGPREVALLFREGRRPTEAEAVVPEAGKKGRAGVPATTPGKKRVTSQGKMTPPPAPQLAVPGSEGGAAKRKMSTSEKSPHRAGARSNTPAMTPAPATPAPAPAPKAEPAKGGGRGAARRAKNAAESAEAEAAVAAAQKENELRPWVVVRGGQMATVPVRQDLKHGGEGFGEEFPVRSPSEVSLVASTTGIVSLVCKDATRDGADDVPDLVPGGEPAALASSASVGLSPSPTPSEPKSPGGSADEGSSVRGLYIVDVKGWSSIVGKSYFCKTLDE